METLVISLGGSVLFQDKVNYNFIKNFKKLISRLNKRFVIVVGGGKPARLYINALKNLKVSRKIQSLTGIAVTRFHAKFLTNYFRVQTNLKIPHNVKEVLDLLRKNKIVICGGLRYKENETSDSAAAKIARALNKSGKCRFINMTNVSGLYNKDPKKFKNAKLIKKISFEKFYKIASKIEYKPGQHFVLDQHASKIIKENKIKTIIMGPNLKNLKNYLKGRKFIGTIIG